MPAPFKRYCVKVSRDTSSLQYENDDLMRPFWGDDYGIACCVSAMRLGRQMQFFGARVNLAKALLYAINGGRDEVSGDQVAPQSLPVAGDVLDYDDVMAKFDTTMEWLAKTYVHAMNCIHYMHDKYFYERLEMALHDRDILRTMAFGIAGLSVVADSLSAIKYGKIRVTRDASGLVVDYQNEWQQGDYASVRQQRRSRRPDRILDRHELHGEAIRKHPTYRNATHTQSVLTITSNVVYGKATGNISGRTQEGASPSGREPIRCTAATAPSWLASCLSSRETALQGRAGRHQLHGLLVAPQKGTPGPKASFWKKRSRHSMCISIAAAST